MSKFTPWSQEQAERRAKTYGKDHPKNGWGRWTPDTAASAFIAGVQWAAEMIEASPRVIAKKPYAQWVDDDGGQFSFAGEHWEAKLVGAQPIKEGK